jgi:uncharacterized protein YjdB
VDFRALGDTLRLTATARDAVGNRIEGVSFSWNSSSGVAQVDDSGLVTAISNGRATIIAMVTGDGISGESEITVLQAADSIAVSPAQVTVLTTGGTQQFSATAWDANGNAIASPVFNWASTNTGVATVNGSGLATVVGIGTTDIEASLDGVAGRGELIVIPAIATIELQPAADTLLAIDDTLRLTALAKDAGGTVIPGISFNWTSSADTIAAVDDEGLVTARDNGSVTITAEVAAIEGIATVVVRQKADSVSVEPAALPNFVSLYDTAQPAAAAWDANGHPVDDPAFAWFSSDTFVAKVNTSGVITAVGNGLATITASLDGQSSDVSVTVWQVLADVAITPAPPDTLRAILAQLQLTAHPQDANGYDIDRFFNVDWTSTVPAIASINSGGQVTAQSNGSTTVTATIDGIVGQVDITVQQAVADVEVEPFLLVLVPQEAALLTATPYDANGFEVPGKEFDWESSNTNVATVSPAGLVRGVAGGGATISATTDEVSGFADVIVEGAAAPSSGERQ